jgi:hypothetical protein
MGIEVGATVVGLELLGMRVDHATRRIVGDAAHIFQAEGMKLAPVGVSGNSTNAPGDLARSIDVEGPRDVGGVYLARVGPTVVYGRQRELGGPIYPTAASILHFVKFGQDVFTMAVRQGPRPYMLPARAQGIPLVEAMANARIAAVLEGTA